MPASSASARRVEHERGGNADRPRGREPRLDLAQRRVPRDARDGLAIAVDREDGAGEIPLRAHCGTARRRSSRAGETRRRRRRSRGQERLERSGCADVIAVVGASEGVARSARSASSPRSRRVSGRVDAAKPASATTRQHVPVAGLDLEDEALDAARRGARGELLEQPRADADALAGRRRRRTATSAAAGSRRRVVARERDDALARPFGERRDQRSAIDASRRRGTDRPGGSGRAPPRGSAADMLSGERRPRKATRARRRHDPVPAGGASARRAGSHRRCRCRPAPRRPHWFPVLDPHVQHGVSDAAGHRWRARDRPTGKPQRARLRAARA